MHVDKSDRHRLFGASSYACYLSSRWIYLKEMMVQDIYTQVIFVRRESIGVAVFTLLSFSITKYCCQFIV